MTELDPTLQSLGDRLERAARADLAATGEPARDARGPVRRPRRITRRLAIVVAVLAIGIPGVAIAADQLISNDQVAQSLPAGTLALAGTNPTCTVVEEGVEYHCTLAKAPASEVTDANGNPAWKGTVESSVDASKHVNGGCRGLRDDGLEWECYIGQAAVDQKIIGPQLLGEYAPSPGVG
jgi:hypothetical protein